MQNKIPKVALLDNHDSFIHNIVHEVAVCNCKWKLFLRDQIVVDDILHFEPTHLILGPGPGSPYEASVMMELIQQVAPQIPILGICLGHQALGVHFGATLGHAKRVCHGKPDMITHTGTDIFSDVPSPTQIGRYHSLHIHSLPDVLTTLATSADGTIQAFKHQTRPIYGIQFHPESILSSETQPIWKHFLSLGTK